jgi:hypothetical protein
MAGRPVSFARDRAVPPIGPVVFSISIGFLESTLKVASQGVSKELSIQATQKDNAMRVEIAQ